MLSKLSVSNYALIDQLTVDFHPGLNTVTGETGAGKSIILGALGLILGNRADLSVLKDKSKKCIVEGVFEIGRYPVKSFFEENDLDYDDRTILRREITPSGKSRAFVNDTPVNLGMLQQLSLSLIDIHSQHQNLELGNQKFQLQLVDTVAGTDELFADYQKEFLHYRELKKKLQELKERAEKASADLDYFQFQFDQLNEAKLQSGEQEELEAELQVLEHAGEIKTELLRLRELLDDERFSVIQHVKESRKAMERIRHFIPEAPGLEERLQSCLLELQDILNEAETQSEKIEHDPARMEQITERLNTIYNLQQKHRVETVQELIELRAGFEQKISEIENFTDAISFAEKELAESISTMEKKAAALSAARKAAFAGIEKAIVSDLTQLGMSKSKFRIQHAYFPECTASGKDSISFLFSANRDVEAAEISKIASGGEMSRLMLAIKNLLRKSKSLPTVIFDEIDSGVSGEIAIKMGNIIKSFSASTQIINITHLPQIAAKGDAHFVVYKYELGGKTYTSIRQLTESERLEELAKMVGGENITESVLKTAEELLKG